MKTALKVLFFACLTILCLFVLEKNKQIRQYKVQEQHNLQVLDTLQLELNGLRAVFISKIFNLEIRFLFTHFI